MQYPIAEQNPQDNAAWQIELNEDAERQVLTHVDDPAVQYPIDAHHLHLFGVGHDPLDVYARHWALLKTGGGAGVAGGVGGHPQVERTAKKNDANTMTKKIIFISPTSPLVKLRCSCE